MEVGREERVALEALELLKKCQPNYPEGQQSDRGDGGREE